MSDFDKFIREQLNQNEDDDFRRMEGNWDKLSSRLENFEATHPVKDPSATPGFSQLKYVHLAWGSIAASLLLLCIWLITNQAQTQRRIEALEKQIDSLPNAIQAPAPALSTQEAYALEKAQLNAPVQATTPVSAEKITLERTTNASEASTATAVNPRIQKTSPNASATRNKENTPGSKENTTDAVLNTAQKTAAETNSPTNLATEMASGKADSTRSANDLAEMPKSQDTPAVTDSTATASAAAPPAPDSLAVAAAPESAQTPDKLPEDTTTTALLNPIKKTSRSVKWPSIAIGLHGIASQEKEKFRGTTPFLGMGTQLQVSLWPRTLSLNARAEWTRADFNMVNPRKDFPYGPAEIKGPPQTSTKKVIGLEGSTVKRSFSLGLAYILTQKTWLTPVVEAGYTWQSIHQDSTTIQLLDIPNGNIEQVQSKPLPKMNGLNTFYLSAGLQKQIRNFTFYTHADFNGLFNGNRPKPATDFNSIRFGIRYTL